jgi:hypothetical protein
MFESDNLTVRVVSTNNLALLHLQTNGILK